MVKKRKHKSPEKNQGIYILFISLIVILPFSYSTKTFDTTSAIRILILNISLIVLLISLTLDVLKGRQNFNFLKFLIYPVFTIYLIISFLSLTQAVNLSVACYDLSKTFMSLILLIIATYYFQKTKNFEILLSKAVVINLSISVSIGISQYIIHASNKSGAELFEALYEVTGLMASKNHYASSLFLLFPFSLYGVFYLKKWWLLLSIYSTLTSVVLIFILQTRSVWIGTVIFLLISAILLLFTRRNIGLKIVKVKKKMVIILIILFGIMLIISLLYKSTDIINLAEYKFQTIFDINSTHNQGRINIWESTVEMSSENFLLGVGAGNWRINMPRYFSDKHRDDYKNWVQPHNDFLWILSEKGIFGLITYVLLFILVIIYGIKILRSSKKPDELIFVILLISMISGFVVLSMLTSPYDRINHQVILILAFSAILAVCSKYSITTTFRKFPLLTKIVFLCASFALIFSLYMNGKIYQSKVYTKKIHEAINSKDYKKIIEYTTLAYNTFFTLDYYSTSLLKTRGTAYLMLNQKKKSIKDLLSALNDHPYNASTLYNISTFYSQQNNFPKAIHYYKKTLIVFPNYDLGIKNLSGAYYSNENYVNAYITILRFNTKINNMQYQNYKKGLELKLN